MKLAVATVWLCFLLVAPRRTMGSRGHFSVQKTQQRIRKIGGDVRWKKIRQYVRDCRACQQFKRPKLAAPGRMEGINDVGDVVSCDFIGPLERGPGNVRYIFTIVDHLSRFGVARKCCRSNTATAVKCLADFVKEFGPIKRLMCDAASYFRSGAFGRFLAQMDTDLVMAPAFAQIERSVRTFQPDIVRPDPTDEGFRLEETQLDDCAVGSRRSN